MVTRSQVVDAENIKAIIESVTGKFYILKTKSELVHPEDMSWLIHIPLGEPSSVRDVYEAHGKLVFESPVVYEVYQDMEYRFSESRYVRLREKLGDDVDYLLESKVREKYLAMLPHVVRFLNEAVNIVFEVNKENATNISLTNYRGSIGLRTEVKVLGFDADEPTIRRTVLAMKEALSLIGKWQNEQRAKSLHMGQIRKMHKRLLGPGFRDPA